ncbi:MAG: heavy metal translocating P-type ATPase [Paracoccaceae bacterium]|nr:heavy metal translocating P-type ATPase [Paracoccaceae bacterium]
MSPQALPRPAVCPACTVPAPDVTPADAEKPGDIILSLPTIHCAGCISTVEKGLAQVKGVRDARVNLSLKRVSISADAGISAEQLVKAVEALGYEAHELDPALLAESKGDKVGRNLLMRLAVAGFAVMNVMLLSVAVWSGAEAATRDLLHWFSAMIALPAIAFSAQPFFANAWSALKARKLNMDVPISLAILLAAGMSLYETTQSGEHAYFDAALSLTFFLLAGRYLDYRTRASARSAAQELAALEVPRAIKLVAGNETLVPVSELIPGDIVVVKPGTRVPVDGQVLTGESEVDRAFLTGESLPAYVGPDAELRAGEINLTGPLTMRVTAQAKDSTLQKVANLVALAETSRNRYTSLADRAAAIYAPGVHLLALLAFVGWYWFGGDLRPALNIAISVLIITCPCALGLAVPAVTTAASGRLYRRGILLKSGTALERLAEADTVIFDKTGTLTLGRPRLDDAQLIPTDRLLIAAALARTSNHPLAKALVEAAGDKLDSGDLPGLTDIREVPGYGIEATLDGEPVRLGRPEWVGVEPPDTTATCLKIGEQEPTVFRFTDALRPGAAPLVAQLKEMGFDIHLVTGDSPKAAEQVARELGIDNVLAGAVPEDKIAAVDKLAAQGRKVLMVGDGLNDTAALARAHVSMSPASALDVARVAADIIILGQDFAVISEAVETARAARSRIKENFALAAIYNLIAVPIALAGLATPLLAALAMSASSITVTLNSWRLR